MRLRNFEICSSIEFQSGGLFWDVHNFASFDGLELICAENAVVMRWNVPSSVSNPWGGYGNKFVGMELHFKNLLFLFIGPRDEEMPMSEDTCVSAVLMVNPAIEHVDHQGDGETLLALGQSPSAAARSHCPQDFLRRTKSRTANFNRHRMHS